MESLQFWFKYVVFWSAIAAVSTREVKSDVENDNKNKETDENMNYISPFIVPTPMYYYGIQYPILAPDHEMFEKPEEDDVQPPKVRSIQKSNYQKACRREVLLWPRPCGWEWDGNTYRWGPGNIFFGGPGFPW